MADDGWMDGWAALDDHHKWLPRSSFVVCFCRGPSRTLASVETLFPLAEARMFVLARDDDERAEMTMETTIDEKIYHRFC